MSYYRICPHCGANLDPGEVCDCQGKEKELPGATNAEQLRAEQNLTAVSDSYDIKKVEDLQV